MNGTQHETESELLSRIDLIEAMIQEGRRKTEYWGWTQVLWGTAYLVAIGWSAWSGKPNIAWPVTTIAAAAIMVALARGRKRERRQSTDSRAIWSVWTAVGIALFLFCFSMGLSGHFELNSLLGGVEILLGLANFASAAILRWRVQFCVAAIWWLSAVATFFVRESMVVPILAAATLIGMIGFGLYLMVRERSDRRRRELHA